LSLPCPYSFFFLKPACALLQLEITCERSRGFGSEKEGEEKKGESVNRRNEPIVDSITTRYPSVG